MTAVDLDALDKLRGALADAIAELHRRSIGRTRRSWTELADGLAPVIDRIANERAAAELREVAKVIRWDGLLQASDYAGYAAQLVDVRADELDPT